MLPDTADFAEHVLEKKQKNIVYTVLTTENLSVTFEIENLVTKKRSTFIYLRKEEISNGKLYRKSNRAGKI